MTPRYRIHQVKLSLHESTADLPKKILKKLGNRDYILTDVEIVRESIDARDKSDIKKVYSVDFSVVRRQRPRDYIRIHTGGKTGVEEVPDMTYIEPAAGERELKIGRAHV